MLQLATDDDDRLPPPCVCDVCPWCAVRADRKGRMQRGTGGRGYYVAGAVSACTSCSVCIRCTAVCSNSTVHRVRTRARTYYVVHEYYIIGMHVYIYV